MLPTQNVLLKCCKLFRTPFCIKVRQITRFISLRSPKPSSSDWTILFLQIQTCRMVPNQDVLYRMQHSWEQHTGSCELVELGVLLSGRLTCTEFQGFLSVSYLFQLQHDQMQARCWECEGRARRGCAVMQLLSHVMGSTLQQVALIGKEDGQESCCHLTLLPVRLSQNLKT